MVFSSSVFLVLFLPILLAVYFLPHWKKRGVKNAILLIFSLCFYAYGEPVFIFALLGSILVNQAAAVQIGKAGTKKAKKGILSAAVIFDVLLLFVFKYLSGLVPWLSGLLPGAADTIAPLAKIAQPVGISFFTFQLMSYVFDVYYGHAAPAQSLFSAALYVSFFPQLVAGPIVRYRDIEREIRERTENAPDFWHGVRRFAYGLAKKVLLADYFARIADNIFSMGNIPTVPVAWLGCAAFSLEIYYDFSGYSDMAIGMGLMFGFHLKENFLYPHTAKSVSQFWKRWHISLGTWFRDYVYIPLGGSRKGNLVRIRNLLIVWILTGLWHGGTVNFILWGLCWFLAGMLERLREPKGALAVYGNVKTLVILAVTTVFFRAQGTAAAFRYIGGMFGIGASPGTSGSALLDYLPLFLIGAVGATPLLSKVFAWQKKRKCGAVEMVWELAVFTLALSEVLTSGFQPFLYFNF